MRLDAALHLGKNAGGSKATLRNCHAQAVLWDEPVLIFSPRIDELLAVAEKLKIPAERFEGPDGFTYVRVRA